MSVLKFSLPIGNLHIHDLGELRANFKLDEVVALYQNKILHHWLVCNGYQAEADKVSALAADLSLTSLVKELLQIFEVKLSEEDVAVQTLKLEHNKTYRALLDDCQKQDFDQAAMAKAYKEQYLQLISHVKEHATSPAIIAADLQEITDHYYDLYSLDSKGFFCEVFEKAPLAMLVALTNPKMRHFYMCEEQAAKDNADLQHYAVSWRLPYIKEQIDNVVKTPTEDLLTVIRTYQGSTNRYWKNLEPKGTKCLILSAYNSSGLTISDQGQHTNVLNGKQLQFNYMILDGLDFFSDNANCFVKYIAI